MKKKMTLRKKKREKNVMVSRHQDENDVSFLVKTHNNAIYFAIVFFLLLSSVPLIGSITTIINGHLTRSWPSTKGKILSADVVRVNSYPSGSVYNGDYIATKKIYRRQVVYSYHVNNEHFTGNYFSSSNLSKEDENMLRDKMGEKGILPDELTIYYSPTNPKKSVIQPGVPEEAYDLLYFGIFCVIIAVMLFCFRKKSKPGPQRNFRRGEPEDPCHGREIGV